jgi:choline transport protein
MADKSSSEAVEKRGHIDSRVSGGNSIDDATLRRLGKKPVLPRSLNFLSALGFSCTVLITWEASLFVFLSGLQNGGPSGIIYGYLVVWAGMLSLMTTLSEMVSMAPTSGGQYHWVSMLAPAKYQKFLGYITGWLTLTGWQATLASGGLLTGTMLQSVVSLTHPEYQSMMQSWHSTLILWGVLVLIYGLNTAFTGLFAKFEGFAFCLHILGFFAILFPLVFLSEHATAEEVFNSFRNDGDWQSQGLSFCVGIIGTTFAFIGGDAAIHLSEETRNATTVIPWSLITTLLINGSFGFAMIIATLFCMGDLDAALAEDSHYPFMPIIRRALDSTAGGVILSSIIVVMTFIAATGCIASSSRVYWAFARDRALPGWRFLSKTSNRTSIPRNAVMTTAIISAIISLINIGNPTAFNGVISVSIAGLLGSYFMASSLLLYRRITGGIREPDSDDSVTNTMGAHLTWGPWRLRGVIGIANNIFACCFILFALFFCFWPPYREVSPQTMNWASLVTGVVLLFSVLYYFVRARKVYTGPLIEI